MTEPPSTAQKIGGAVLGFGRGAGLAFILLILGMGAGAFPIVGWAIAIGCVGAALIAPFLGAWLGYRGETMKSLLE